MSSSPSNEINPQTIFEKGNDRVTAKPAIPQEDVAASQVAAQGGQQGDFRNAQAALGQGAHGTAEQGKEHHDAHHREAGFIGALQRRIGSAVFGRVGQRYGGAVNGLDWATLE